MFCFWSTCRLSHIQEQNVDPNRLFCLIHQYSLLCSYEYKQVQRRVPESCFRHSAEAPGKEVWVTHIFCPDAPRPHPKRKMCISLVRIYMHILSQRMEYVHFSTGDISISPLQMRPRSMSHSHFLFWNISKAVLSGKVIGQICLSCNEGQSEEWWQQPDK